MPATPSPAPAHDRYHRQAILPGIGTAGQAAIRRTTVGVVGCGALGSVVIDHLARAGIGRLILIDRDVVELTNLQRQILYREADAAAGTPKAEAAARAVAAINSEVAVERHVADIGPGNARSLLAEADLIVDGLDNFETRYLLNDLAVASGRPWIYGGAVGTGGMSMVILPVTGVAAPGGSIHWTADAATPCLRCVFDGPPAPGTSPTCDTAGVLAPAVASVAARQAAEALKLAAGRLDAVDRRLVTLDLWSGDHRTTDLSAARRPDCPCCGAGRFDWLDGRERVASTTLCGRIAVQVAPPAHPESGPPVGADLEAIAARLAAHGPVQHSELLVRGRLDEAADAMVEGPDPGASAGPGTAPEPNTITLTVFADGRAIIHGTANPERARALYARYVGC